MIVFELQCEPGGHRFEGWFASSEDYAAQHARGLVSCPHCASAVITKAPMAPAVGRKGNQATPRNPSRNDAPMPVASGPSSPEAAKVMAALAELQARALKQSRWVGNGFAEVSRQMHYGERETEAVHGQASPSEAKALLDEGIAVMPLPFPIAPPEEIN